MSHIESFNEFITACEAYKEAEKLLIAAANSYAVLLGHKPIISNSATALRYAEMSAYTSKINELKEDVPTS